MDEHYSIDTTRRKEKTTSYEEYERLLIDQPTKDDYFVIDDDDAEHEDGTPVQYKRIVSKECYDSIPLWTWEQIFNFVGRVPPPRKSRRTEEPEGTAEEHGVRGMYNDYTTAQTTSSGSAEPESV